MPKAIGAMIVHHSRRLHMRVDDGAADKFETALFQVLAERIRFGTGCRNVVMGF